MLAHGGNGTIREREARQCYAARCAAFFVLFLSPVPFFVGQTLLNFFSGSGGASSDVGIDEQQIVNVSDHLPEMYVDIRFRSARGMSVGTRF